MRWFSKRWLRLLQARQLGASAKIAAREGFVAGDVTFVEAFPHLVDANLWELGVLEGRLLTLDADGVARTVSAIVCSPSTETSQTCPKPCLKRTEQSRAQTRWRENSCRRRWRDARHIPS